MSVAVAGAFVIGQWPEAAMVMALYAIAELIEARSVDRARNAISGLLALSPDTADLRQPDGTWKTMPVGDVPVSYTHLDVYKRQSQCWACSRPLATKSF